MIINRYLCENMGGIIRQGLEFSPGMNVIYGPNEAGKSTIVEGILATLFRSHRLRKSVADKEFEEKFRPYPYGDSIKGQLVFSVSGQEYVLDKEWGSSPQISLTIGGQILKDEKAVLTKLQQLLRYGEGTYTNVVFARQSDLRVALERLQTDAETGQALSDVLHRAVMSLDGISLEGLKKRLDEEFEALSGHWDLEQGRPEKGRGLDNPWRVGKGLVLDCYYKQEGLYRRIRETRQLEDDYSAAVDRLRKLSAQREKVKGTKDKYAALEGDITARVLLENKLQLLEKETAELKEIIELKPKMEAELKLQKAEIERIKKEQLQVSEELALAEKLEKVKESQQLLERSKKLQQAIEMKRQELAGLSPVPEEKLNRLMELHNQLITTRATLKAATLQGSLKSGPQIVYITRGLKEKESLIPGTEFSAEGFFRLETEDGLVLEVSAGDLDFEALSREFNGQKAEYLEILQELQVENLAEAKKRSAVYAQLSGELQILESKYTELCQGRDLAAMEKEIAETAGQGTRPPQELKLLLTQCNEALRKAEVQEAKLQSVLDDWLEKYGELELSSLLETFAQRSAELEEKRKKLQSLAPLPEEFASAQEFQKEMIRLRQLDDRLAEEEREAQKLCLEKEHQLPETTIEELQLLYNQAKTDFIKAEHRLQKVRQIRQVFEEKSKEMAQDSYLPLVESFSRYLTLLTLDKYKAGEVSEDLQVRIIRQDKVELPSTLLSTGTSDTVLLALRLSLLETLFQEKEGLVVLDDCLINLDPARKEKAAEVLREFAKRYQIIFTTCDPQTCDMLGGNTISL